MNDDAAAEPGPDSPSGAPGRSPDRPRGRGRGGMSGRSLRRTVPRPGFGRDRWPVTALVTRLALEHPEPWLWLLGQRRHRWRDGRRLHRGMQLVAASSSLIDRAEADLVPETMRRQLRRLTRIATPVRRAVHVFERRAPGPAGEIPVRVYQPYGTARQRPGIVYFHGGGFVVGDLHTHDGSCRLLADVSGCVVVAVDYRLAPEHPFPAAVDDAVAAYRWVLDHAEELSIDARAVGVMGDSAGGTLAAVTSQEARRLDLPPPVAQGLIYPLVDFRMQFGSLDTFAEGFSLTRRTMDWFHDQYLAASVGPDPAPEALTDPRISPLCGDLTGLPPAVIATAGFDPLRDDGLAYADALRRAGVEVVLRCYDDFLHGFYGMTVMTDAAAAAVEIDRAMGRLMWRSRHDPR